MKNNKTLKKIETASDAYWKKVLLKEKISIFKEAYSKVPAYKDFLKEESSLKFKSIKSDKEFLQLPVMNKQNYLKKYPMNSLLLGGSLKQPLVLTSTSGSTGTPFYFPRTELIDQEYSYIIERFLTRGGSESKEPTLVLVCFGMGVWIGGVITYQAFEMAIRRSGLPVSILTPGINKAEIIKALKLIAPNYKNIILIGYPPFIKDVVDEAVKEKIDFTKYNTRFIFAAEIFSESFRDYVCEKTSVKNIYTDTLSIYGSADIGAMAWETGPLILLKRLLLQKEEYMERFFGVQHIMPTIAYFNPNWLQFEGHNGEVLITGRNAIPFVRYAIGDHGGTFSFSEMKQRLKNLGFDFESEVKKAGLTNELIQLPCVYVYERKDLSVTLYGLQIYPEIIREVLINEKFINFFTGKFSMFTKFDEGQNQYLEIVTEMKSGVLNITEEKASKLLEEIVHNLIKKNSEFRELQKYLGDRANPKIVFVEYENKEYFSPGIKQKWVRK